MFTLAMPAAPFSLTSWAMSTLCKAGFFLACAAAVGVLGEEETPADSLAFLCVGEGEWREGGGREEKVGLEVARLLVEGLAMTRPENKPDTGKTGLAAAQSQLGLA